MCRLEVEKFVFVAKTHIYVHDVVGRTDVHPSPMDPAARSLSSGSELRLQRLLANYSD
jgi:hypothetical protein